MDFVDTISLNILINPHTETALFITHSTRKPALLRDSDSAINISTFCYSVLCTVDYVDTFNGFVVHLKWIRCTPEVDFVDTISRNILIISHTETAHFIALSTHKPALLRDSDSAN